MQTSGKKLELAEALGGKAHRGRMIVDASSRCFFLPFGHPVFEDVEDSFSFDF